MRLNLGAMMTKLAIFYKAFGVFFLAFERKKGGLMVILG